MKSVHAVRIARQKGWGTSEYLAVLLGLMAVWKGTELVLTRIQRHHDEFSWMLMLPL